MITFDVVTLFPRLFTEHLNNLPFKRAIDNNVTKVNLWNLRDFAIDKRGTVDDKPFGGGVGMILMIEPIFKALSSIYPERIGKSKSIDSSFLRLSKKSRIVVLSPRGKRYDQKLASELANMEQITLICGRYEGIDARVEKYLATDVISIGDYVVSGGELPALVLMESIVRLQSGVLEKKEATKNESFTKDFIEYPQYTRPGDFEGLKAPDVLLSGNHEEVEKWRKEQSRPLNN